MLIHHGKEKEDDGGWDCEWSCDKGRRNKVRFSQSGLGIEFVWLRFEVWSAPSLTYRDASWGSRMDSASYPYRIHDVLTAPVVRQWSRIRIGYNGSKVHDKTQSVLVT